MDKKHTLLVVEDDHDLRALTMDLLVTEGYTVVGARNGREAITLILADLTPDLVVLDLCMPVMSGPELLTWMRAHPTIRTVPVLVVSCLDRTLVPPLPHEVQGWVLKPPSPTELLAKVHRICSREANKRSGSTGRLSSGSHLRTAM